ncbi:hypothetical protein THAOC_01579 [Thalassiosira oceanica]|uniref:RING-type domain-containing protein n=1 Tax=Thalassiosira oceanica TaxID=159749 RepID=K0TMZ0_THAOC|nr:hypothetical protein THAOC_01579 [Thalassiosira oceanica]|eukprot:EJK76651.1 hypothetical protein THAOC_01579 [Thalassiosira oceanica]
MAALSSCGSYVPQDDEYGGVKRAFPRRAALPRMEPGGEERTPAQVLPSTVAEPTRNTIRGRNSPDSRLAHPVGAGVERGKTREEATRLGSHAVLNSPGVPAAGPPPVTEEELMNSGHELHESYTCLLCCLPIALPAPRHSKFAPCCMKMVCNGCILASRQNENGGACPFCRTPTPDSAAALLALVQKRADAKDPVAIELLASAYFDRCYGLQQDIHWAIELWTEAARLGDLGAHFKLGGFYYHGEGVEQDMARGIRLLQHSAIQGHPESRYSLGLYEYHNRNHELAAQHWMISTKMGSERSLNEIRKMFMEGHATKAQYAEALRVYQKALEDTKSPQREEAEAFFSKCMRSD